jgi:hypothetical protein
MQNFIIENQGLLIGLVAVIAIVLSAIKLVPFLKSKNIVNDNNLQLITQTSKVAIILFKNLNLSQTAEKQAETILNICLLIVNFIQNVSDSKDNIDLEKVINEAIDVAFKELNITMNDNIRQLIDAGVSAAIVKMNNKVQ